jgi:hypothetical protein
VPLIGHDGGFPALLGLAARGGRESFWGVRNVWRAVRRDGGAWQGPTAAGRKTGGDERHHGEECQETTHDKTYIGGIGLFL